MLDRRDGIVVIFWGPHSRHSEDIAERLGAKLVAIHYFHFSWRRMWLAPAKYVLQHFTTLAVLLRRRPTTVYVIIPPTFAALSVYLYYRLTGTPYVMDVHGFSLTSPKWRWTIPLQRFLAQRARATVVDQRMYQRTFDAWGAHTVLLERRPKTRPVSQLPPRSATDPYTVTLVSIFAEDEPIAPVIEAARRLPDVRFCITGDTRRADAHMLASAPANVVFTGYLKGDDFWHLLGNSQAVMTLTEEPFSLVSGGIESMALGKPTILSRQPVLTEYFTKGTVFVEHTAESIIAGVRYVQTHEDRLIREISELAVEKRERWERALRELQILLGDHQCGAVSVLES